MRELALIGAIVIHGPDFFVAAAITDKKYLAFGDALNPAAETVDDFVGKLVGDEASGVIGGNVGILFAENLGRGSVFDVVEPALNGDFSGGDGKIAEGQHGGVGRRRIPDSEGDFRRLAGDL